MCRSPDVTLPGHHGTFGLRMSRALVRMKMNEPRKPASSQSATVRAAGSEVAITTVPMVPRRS